MMMTKKHEKVVKKYTESICAVVRLALGDDAYDAINSIQPPAGADPAELASVIRASLKEQLVRMVDEELSYLEEIFEEWEE